MKNRKDVADRLAFGRAGDSDIPAIAALLAGCHRRADGTVSDRYSVDAVRRGIGSFTVARLDGEVVGTIACGPAVFSASGWELACWGVRPDRQGCGIGALILDHVLAYLSIAKPDDHFVLIKTSRADMMRARGFEEFVEGMGIHLGPIAKVWAALSARNVRGEAA